MSDIVSTHLNKIRLMGNILSWVAMLSLLLVLMLLIPIGWLYFEFGEEVNLAELAKNRVDGGADRKALENLPTEPIKLKKIFCAFCIGAGFSSVMSIFLFLIGNSWRKSKPFSRNVVTGLRGLGIVFLLQTAFLIAMPNLSEQDTNVAIESLNTHPFQLLSFVPLTALGLLLLTMSWVVDNGRKLQQAEELTI